jgi:hypothetical protein
VRELENCTIVQGSLVRSKAEGHCSGIESNRQDLNLATSQIHCNIALEDETMTNRLFSVLFATAVTCLALALSIQRRTQAAREFSEQGIEAQVNVPGYSFSKN